jgi:hypothetical protein
MPLPCSRWLRKTVKENWPENAFEKHDMHDVRLGKEWTCAAGTDEKKRVRFYPNSFYLLAERTGLEPATPGVTGRYSNQLNYRSSNR